MQMTEAERENYEERAAIMQWLAGMTREEAEACALECLEAERER